MELEGFSFDHIVSKKGRDIMFGELAEYIDSKIEDSEYSENKDHYITECPYCKSAYLSDRSYEGPYTKHKLYVTKDKQTGFCFRCDRAFVNSDDSIKIAVDTPEPGLLNKDFSLVKLPDTGTWRLGLYDEFDDEDELGKNYLIRNRHVYFQQIDKMLGIKYTNHNPVIPFFFKGELIYYQIRFAFGSHKIKYFSPPISHKPAYIIEHGTNKNFIICEGTFDAISLLLQAPNYTPFAVLGSTITDYQLTMLRTYIPDKILVFMDETELSVKVANRIRSCINYADVDIIPSNGTDPEERLKSKIISEQSINWIK